MKRKVLHIVGTLDVGGIEKWVCNMINYELNNEDEIDFYIYSLDASRNKIVPQIKLPIGKIFFTSSNSITGRISSFIKIIRRIEPEVIHFHPGYSSGIYLVLAKLFSKNLTIVHSHSDRRKIDFKISKLRKCYIEIMKFLLGISAITELPYQKKPEIHYLTGITLFITVVYQNRKNLSLKKSKISKTDQVIKFII
ncbi:hypothetical protein [Enterobacter hormaechei]|uniref:hypothetical protein n=1 Tax=Enterobacter hormaechei TaxID=158836 RepID=UPI001EDA91FA|nr:hypothetical protein [Enterobacter hormaechei]